MLDKTPIKIFLLFILPIFLFIVWSYLIYPLSPHCSLGRGTLGCTPMCEATAYFDDGRASDYKIVPCFYEDPKNFQTFLYQNQTIYYLLFGTTIGFVAFKLGIKSFLKKILYIVFAPFALIIESKEMSTLSRILVIVSSFFLLIEWGMGYLVVIQTITGTSLLNL